MNPNKKYKDSLFASLFSDREKILELYSALEGKEYPAETEVVINTLQEALYLDRINDVSFLIDDKLVVLVENQATINNNMPLRFLLYISRIYEKIIDNKSIYKRKLLSIPTPEFIVLYNGSEEYTDYKELKLSDSFKDKRRNIDLELIVKIYNINKGHNEEIVKRSKTLNDYIVFITRVRNNKDKKKMTLEEAIKEAILYCTNEGYIKEFLEEHGSEVLNMIFTEFNLDAALEVAKEEGREEGKEEGAKTRSVEIAKKALKINMPIENIIELTGLTREEIEYLKNE